MHIAFFSKELPSDRPNGVSCQVHRLANALFKMGHSITCFSFSPKPADSCYEVVQLRHACQSKMMKKIEAGIVFKKMMHQRFDLYHFHGDDYLIAGCKRRVRTFYGSAFYETLHARSVSRFTYQALFYCFELISSLRTGKKVAISAMTKAVLPRITSIIPCGVPLDRFKPASTKTTHPSLLFRETYRAANRGIFSYGSLQSIR